MNLPTLHRRTVLRGGGVALALPFLEAMLPRRASAAQPPPKRYVVCFAGMSLGRDDTGRLSDIVPDRVGAGYDLKPPLLPLGELKSEVSVVTGLRIPVGGAGGRQAEFHKSSLSPLLSGMRAESASPNCWGPTSDQIVARAPGFLGKTRFPFLSYRVQAQPYRGGGNVGVISWQARGQKNDPIVSPAMAFDNLFAAGGADPTNPAEVAASSRRARREASVLDVVGARAVRLRARLGLPDRARIERHFDEVRALEQRLDAIVTDTGAGGQRSARRCNAPARPGADPQVEKVLLDATEIGYSQEEERAQALTGLLARAFACDLTRVATLQLTCTQCFMNIEPIAGVKIDLHELAHLHAIAGGHEVAQQKLMQMYGWHVKHFAALVAQLRQEIGSDGRPLLDHTVLVLVNEGGLGPAEGKNPASHSTDNMMALVAGGRAGGLAPGRHIATDGEHPARVITACMRAAGVEASGLGDVGGHLAAL